MAKARRTTHRSTAGRKLYAVRDAGGKFNDIQTYERAHRADLAKTSEGELAAREAATVKKAAPARKAATRNTAARKAAAGRTAIRKTAKKR